MITYHLRTFLHLYNQQDTTVQEFPQVGLDLGMFDWLLSMYSCCKVTVSVLAVSCFLSQFDTIGRSQLSDAKFKYSNYQYIYIIDCIKNENKSQVHSGNSHYCFNNTYLVYILFECIKAHNEMWEKRINHKH